jgi:pimeloyl-ACP methyl ester carboxylesterase
MGEHGDATGRGATDSGAANRERVGRWRSPRAAERYAAAESVAMQRAWAELGAYGLPDPPDELTADTPYGPTHAYRWPGGGPPLVLVHGAGTSSLMWPYLIAHLPGRAIVAVDVVGEPGHSVQTAPVDDAADLARWFEAALAGLDVERGHVVGASYGGYIAVVHAQRHPGRVASMSLLEPVLDPVRPQFWTYGMKAAAAFALPRRLGAPLLRRLRLSVVADDPDARTLALLGQTRFRRVLPRPEPVGDALLAAVRAPLLVAIGAASPIHHADRLAERVRAARPDAQVEVLADAGHTLPAADADRVAPLLAAFVDGVDAGRGR